MRYITVDEWMHIPAGETVPSGYNYDMTAPAEEGTYTLYEIADNNNIHQGWKWEKENAG